MTNIIYTTNRVPVEGSIAKLVSKLIEEARIKKPQENVVRVRHSRSAAVYDDYQIPGYRKGSDHPYND